ncbi:MAG TPA: hypothetical protein VGY55_06430 [Pirellulales bacterium]|nr:hypothetical protein [Pirellulales bacterium]
MLACKSSGGIEAVPAVGRALRIGIDRRAIDRDFERRCGRFISRDLFVFDFLLKACFRNLANLENRVKKCL